MQWLDTIIGPENSSRLSKQVKEVSIQTIVTVVSVLMLLLFFGFAVSLKKSNIDTMDMDAHSRNRLLSEKKDVVLVLFTTFSAPKVCDPWTFR